jgi:hypothetical protein
MDQLLTYQYIFVKKCIGLKCTCNIFFFFFFTRMEKSSDNQQQEGRSDITSYYEEIQEEKQEIMPSENSVNVPGDEDRAFKAISECRTSGAEDLENKPASLMSTGLSQLGNYSSGSESEDPDDSKPPSDGADKSNLGETTSQNDSQWESTANKSATVEESLDSVKSDPTKDCKEMQNIAEESRECAKETEENDEEDRVLDKEKEDIQSEQGNNEKSSEDKQLETECMEAESSEKKLSDIVTEGTVTEGTGVSEIPGTASERSQRSESLGFEVKDPIDIPTVIRKPSAVEVIDEESNSSFIRMDGKMKDSPLECDVPPSPYGVSEMSETPGPPSPTSVIRYS